MQRPLLQVNKAIQLRRHSVRHRSTATYLHRVTSADTPRHRRRHHRLHCQLLPTIYRQQVQVRRPNKRNTTIRHDPFHKTRPHRERL